MTVCRDFGFAVLRIGFADGAVTEISRESVCTGARSVSVLCRGGSEPFAELVIGQLSEYFEGKRKALDFPTAPSGTEFQKSVWRALRSIPYGETRTYGELASAVGKPAAARAVGAACGKNPLLISIPCHRAVGKNGSLIGFSAGLDLKKALLDIEAGKLV